MSEKKSTTRELTLKQRRFVEEYLCDLNATQAAIRTGYSIKTARSQGQRLLTIADIQAEIQRLMAKRSEKTEITAEYVLGTIKDTVERCRQGMQVFDREGNPTGEWKFDPSSVMKGCELLGKHIKLFSDKLEVDGAVEVVFTRRIIRG